MRVIFAIAGVLALGSGAFAMDAARYGAPPGDLNAKLDRLVAAYPDFIASHDDKFLTLKDGRRFAISDGRSNKTFDEMVEHADIDDMFYADYVPAETAVAPGVNVDPGRVRFEPLFNAMYGDCDRGEVQPKMRSIAWLPKHHGGRVSITSANGVDKALEAVSAELDEMPDKFIKYLIPNSGTYNCRKIAGSSARSVHAWGAAIDINSAASDYWRWSKDGWHNRIPVEIARVFERHGFIWGGRWWHYDTMHFEYRPELLPAGGQ
ncbi:MAG: M15 family metallopeptidase [Alphaproteobacteria bacterium]|nr:M15 family metallopeptidase [Alphaproteobacteria bacterium]